MNQYSGNIEKYEYIKNWITQQINDSSNKKLSLNNFIFVTGNSGIGKTYKIKNICEELNLYYIYISTHNCSSSEELKDILIKSISSSLIQILTNNNKKKIIIIDEFESLMAIDKTINTTLLNFLLEEKIKKIPIICISSLDIIKKIGTIKKKCKIIELSLPTMDEVVNVLLSNNYTNIQKDNLKEIIINCNYNINQCIKYIENNSLKQNDTMDKIININLLFSYGSYNRDYIRRIILTDPWQIALKYHENLITELQNRNNTIINNNKFYKKFLKNMIFFDYTMCNNNMEISSDIFSSLIYDLFTIPLKQRSVSKIEKFTKILSYLSLQKKYIKKSYSEKFPLYQIGNYHINIIGRNFIFFN
jgi:hypothetical protein